MRTPSTLQARCSNCSEAMHTLKLEGHYKREVLVDVCFSCHHFWFDALESVRLSGLGWVHLLRQMIASPPSHGVMMSQLSCVRCSTPLKEVNNLTRFGRFAALECPSHHGHYQSFSLLLAERGLVRPVSSQDRQALHAQCRDLECLNCGAIQSNETRGQALPPCAHCRSPLVMIDLPRLTQALLVRHGHELVVDEPAEQLALACEGCGAALDPTQDVRCGHCDHAVALPSLRNVTPLLDRIEPLLLGQQPRQARPWGEKLRRMKGDYTHTALYRVLHAMRSGDFYENDWQQQVRLVCKVIGLVALVWLLNRCSA